MNFDSRQAQYLKRLKHALIDAELDLPSLAALTGLSRSLIGKIAAGIKKPSRRAGTRIESVLGVRIFSTAREYRNRQRKDGPSIIEFEDRALPNDLAYDNRPVAPRT